MNKFTDQVHYSYCYGYSLHLEYNLKS